MKGVRAKKSTEKYVTMPVFERAMATIAKSFSAADERFDRMESGITTLTTMVRSSLAETREYNTRISILEGGQTKHDRRLGSLENDVLAIKVKLQSSSRKSKK